MITRSFPRPSILSYMCSIRSRESSSRAEVEEEDRSRPRFLSGNNSSGRKNSRGLNIRDSIEDGGTIVGGGIGLAVLTATLSVVTTAPAVETSLAASKTKLDFEAVVTLQVELEEEGRQRIVRVHEPVRSFNVEECEDIQARVEADEELVQRLQAEETEKYTEAEQARMLTLFETTMRKVNTFVPIKSEVDRAVPELAAGSSKRDAEYNTPIFDI
ncbi:hypothetical protein Tco_0397675 [Tanacetum coccineum]